MSESALPHALLRRATKKPSAEKTLTGMQSGHHALSQHAGLKSSLLASLLDIGDASEHLTVLDVGPALPETVAFFNQYRCHLHIIDLYSEGVFHDQDNTNVALWREHFQRLLNFRSDTRFDICLFWDFLNFLDGSALEAFGQALRPFLHPRSRGHGFGVLNARATMLNLQYGVLGHDMISVRSRANAELVCYPHSQTELKSRLTAFDIEKGTLLPDGRLEMLFHTV